MKQISETQYQELLQLRKDKAVLSEKVASLENQLEWFRKQIFGQKSEKNLPLDPNALTPGLFDELLSEQEQALIAQEASKLEEKINKTITVPVTSRKKVNSIDTSKLEVKEIIIEPTDIDTDQYTRLGEEITDKLIHIAARIYIERTIRPKYVLKSSLQIQNPEQQAFIVASLALSPLPKCIASSSLLTEIILQKFLYHLPFYRVIQKFKEIDFTISDSTIGDWYAATCTKLKPIYDILKQQVLSCDYIQVDESTLPVIDNEKKRAVKGYVWVVRDAVNGDVFFHYADGSRSQSTAKALLGSFRGAIQSDAYNAYDQFEDAPGKLLLGCAAHARRRFTEALEEDKQKASEALLLFGKLYGLEKNAKENEFTFDQIKEMRKEKAYPILQTFEKWLIDNYSKVLNESRMGKAISYTYSILPRLSRYILDGRYQLDNNGAENAIRPLVIGRKNYLFCGNSASAIRASMMYSFISSCKAANLEPREWFSYLLDNLAQYQQDNRDLKELLPRNFKHLTK